MKLLRVFFQDQIRWARLEQGNCHLFTSSSETLAQTASPLPNLEKLQRSPGGPTVAMKEVKVLAPVVGMEKIVCIGTNYAEHAREMGGEPPTLPVVFSKFPSTVIGPGADVVHPAICTKLDFEAELVVVVGKTGRNILRENAFEYVFGYCCGNDVTSRDWQKEKPGGQWLLGKSFDTFAPLGPILVTRDEIPDPHRLPIQFRLNGEVMQDSNTDQLIFPIDFLISHLSQFFTLKPGDLIFTGTPPGVGAGRKPPRWLQPGDQMEVEVAGLGILRNQVVGAG